MMDVKLRPLADPQMSSLNEAGKYFPMQTQHKNIREIIFILRSIVFQFFKAVQIQLKS